MSSSAVRWSLRIKAYAKLNLGLQVFRRREDGYHELSSLMQNIDLADELVLEEAGEGIALKVEPPLDVPAEENLVYRAAELLFTTASLAPSLRIELMKRIPVGAGLGGGSSDGAATLVALNELLKLGLEKDELRTGAAELGSDVPFFLEGGTCLVSGRGERVERLPPLPQYHLVLLIPPFPLSTAEVYDAFDRMRDDAREADEKSPRLLQNDLERAAVALRPELEDYRDFLQRAAPDFFGMSGSGPTWFAGFRERKRAVALATEAARLPGRALLTKIIKRSYEIC
jgi:4-diphosphocytidyl-2-C-methyl-D-erythritol kinase